MQSACRPWVVLCLYLALAYCCIQIPREDCPPPTEKCRCRKLNTSIVCCNITSNFELREGLNCAKIRQNIKKVHIHNATINTFNVNGTDWSGLESLSVTNGQIHKLDGNFKGNLSCIDFSKNNISEINPLTFYNLSRLETLDLSFNNFKRIPNISVYEHNFTLDVSNNSLMWCNSVLDVLVKFQNTSKLHFRNKNNTQCLSFRSFHWFNSTDAMTLAQVELLTKGLDEECPKPCTCATYRTDITANHPISIKLNVNCSGQGLTELPPLPPNTIFLDVSNNMIRSLKPLCVNETYAELREFIADNNIIDSIMVLEGSKFIDNFALLSLRNNRIKFIPTYILSNAFDRTYYGNKVVKIGGNRLQCDCGATQVKMWLLNNKNFIKDYEQVMCDSDFERVIDIDASKICVHEKDWTDYIYYIITLELFLLVSLVSKVTYDYWVFKQYGYLPWPASSMPKLPCDCCFES